MKKTRKIIGTLALLSFSAISSAAQADDNYNELISDNYAGNSYLNQATACYNNGDYQKAFDSANSAADSFGKAETIANTSNESILASNAFEAVVSSLQLAEAANSRLPDLKAKTSVKVTMK